MNVISYIEEIYKNWDGTPEHATICMRQIHLAIHVSSMNFGDDD